MSEENDHKISNMVFGLTKIGMFLGGYIILRRALSNLDRQYTVEDNSEEVEEYVAPVLSYEERKQRRLERLQYINSENTYSMVKDVVIREQVASRSFIMRQLQLHWDETEDFMSRLVYDEIIKENGNGRYIVIVDQKYEDWSCWRKFKHLYGC